jgi:putative phosphoesterase
MRNSRKLIGVISDTHGLLRPEVPEIFEGVDLILHAGDIGTSEVLDQLRSVAPVVAVRGNNDTGSWASSIPETEVAEIGGARVYILHNLKELDLSPAAAGLDAVISGHSHRPSLERRAGVLYLNPGSAGPRRFKLPISVARLIIDGRKVNAELISVQVHHG